MSKFKLIFFENDSFEILHQVLIWRFHTTTWILHWKSLLLFFRLVWILPSRSPSTTFFSQKWVSFLKSVVVCSIYHLFAALTENITVRLRLLFHIMCYIVHNRFLFGLGREAFWHICIDVVLQNLAQEFASRFYDNNNFIQSWHRCSFRDMKTCFSLAGMTIINSNSNFSTLLLWMICF